MLNSEIINYIKSELAKGNTSQTITESLMKAGWQNNDIQEAFNTISLPTNPVPISSQSSNQIVTEKDYPIQGLWVFKSTIISLFFLIFWIPLAYPNFSAVLGDIKYNTPIIFRILYIITIIVFITFPLIFRIINQALTRVFFHYFIEEKILIVNQGILSKKQRNLPYGLIQNVFIKQDILDRLFSLASLRIENASQGGGIGSSGVNKFFGMNINRQQTETVGSSGNNVNIPGLKKDDAEALKAILLQRMKENPIEDSQSGL